MTAERAVRLVLLLLLAGGSVLGYWNGSFTDTSTLGTHNVTLSATDEWFYPVATDGSRTFEITSSAPTITWVNSSFSITPVAGAMEEFQFHFNASDNNGAADLNDSSAAIVIALGTVSTTSTACTPTDDGNTVTYNCSVSIPYYYNASASWAINASVSDLSGSSVYDATQTFIINTLKAVSLSHPSLTFVGVPGEQDIAAALGPQIVRNVGNFDFTVMNLTAFDLVNGTYSVGAGRFTANVTASGGPGTVLANASSVPIVGVDLTHGGGAQQSVNLYLDLPLGLPSLAYSSGDDWLVSVE